MSRSPFTEPSGGGGRPRLGRPWPGRLCRGPHVPVQGCVGALPRGIDAVRVVKRRPRFWLSGWPLIGTLPFVTLCPCSSCFRHAGSKKKRSPSKPNFITDRRIFGQLVS
jgi:hypothetical protein